MQTVGQILKRKRRVENLSLDEVEKKTRIKKKFLKSLEEDSFKPLPSEAYARGFVKNYAEFLGLPAEKMLAIFRRQIRREERSSLPFKRIRQQSPWKITPERIKGILILFLLLLFFGYLFKQYQFLTTGPSLRLFEPQNNLLVRQEKIVVRGKTEPEAKIFINDLAVYPDDQGEFSQEILLSEGRNEIVVSVEGQAGKKRTVIREVTFEPL